MMMRKMLFTIVAASLAASTAIAAPTQEPLTAQGPAGTLAGTLIRPADGQPVILVIPGSGPTDRDGNNPLGVTAAPYRLLAEALGARGIGTLRIDKRGMFGSAAPGVDPNAVTIERYADDVATWADTARKATGRECIWLLGHSEGGLVALAAARRMPGLCGAITVAAPGRKLGDVMREQLRANPANAPLLDAALAAIARLEAGERVDVSAMPAPLQGLFAPPVQGFLIDLFGHDPAALAAGVSVPLLVIQGGNDLQVPESDGETLRAAQRQARYVLLPDMNHVLKDVPGKDRPANLAAYADPSRPVSPGLVDAIAGFVSPGTQ